MMTQTEKIHTMRELIKVRDTLKSHGVTLAKIADALGMSPSTVHRIYTQGFKPDRPSHHAFAVAMGVIAPAPDSTLPVLDMAQAMKGKIRISAAKPAQVSDYTGTSPRHYLAYGDQADALANAIPESCRRLASAGMSVAIAEGRYVRIVLPQGMAFNPSPAPA